MGLVSFLSTVHSLPSIAPLPSSTSPRLPLHAVSLFAPFSSSSNFPRLPLHAGIIRCKIEDNDAVDKGFCRRDLINSFGAAIGMELIANSSSLVQAANAADLIQRRQRSDFQSNIKTTLYTAIKGNPDIVPSILMLALNDAVTYDKATKTGGPNGSIRFSRPENKGLSGALNLLEDAKKEIDSYSKGGPISYSDLIQLAAQSAMKASFLAAAIRKCEEKGNLLYSAYGSNGQWGLFDRNFGRSDSQELDPEGRVPQWEKASVQEMKDKFSAIGFGPRQLALMSVFLGPDQAATESLLATDLNVLPWVQKYQRSRETVSETDYERACATPSYGGLAGDGDKGQLRPIRQGA